LNCYETSDDGKTSYRVNDIFNGIDFGFKVTAAFPAVPEVVNLPIITILGPFGSNQPIATLDAAHS
jgi:hypothetical protein